MIERRRGGEIEQRLDEHVRSAVQVGDGDLLVAVVPRVGFAGEPPEIAGGASSPVARRYADISRRTIFASRSKASGSSWK